MKTYKNCLILAILESISPRQAISVAFEMPLRMPWIPMLLEWIGALPEPALRHDPSVLTLFVCALEADALLLETWRRVCGLFDVALGASTRCAAARRSERVNRRCWPRKSRARARKRPSRRRGGHGHVAPCLYSIAWDDRR